MSEDKNLLICYNRGCGKKFFDKDNKEDSCQHHPGQPVFHDAYKGWSCCKKKSTDFSEFLNIKGCTKSHHSNIKPLEQPKSVVNTIKPNDIKNNISKPLKMNSIKRPLFNSLQVKMEPTITPLLLQQIKNLTFSNAFKENDHVIAVGQSCQNNSCKDTFKGPESNKQTCTYHPGAPIFHEGIKYWSCCKKKTTDFTAFLEQPGCIQGNHVWIQKLGQKTAKCRMDWYQTESDIILFIFAKKYNPDTSVIKLNPVRLTVNLYFQENSIYNLDIQLKGIINVEKSYVTMLPTKVEIKLKKEEPGTWDNLEIKDLATISKPNELYSECNNTSERDIVDLSDI